MDNAQPSFLDLLLEAHIDLGRQGPGSPAAMKQALAFLGPLDRFAQVLDLGCGTGGQTLDLAEQLPGTVTGLDMFPAFVQRLTERAEGRGLADRVKGVVGNMEDLPFPRHSFDLIWSEGAIDNIGFGKGLRYWHDFLRPGGCVAVSCPSWITEEHPAEVDRFWAEAGSRLDPVGTNIGILQQAGYAFVGSFELPRACWTGTYFIPRAEAISRLARKYPHCDTMAEYATVNQREVELFQQYSQHYGYVFYIGQAL